MAPFTFVGVVGPTYAGSELLSWSVDDGCVIVLVGHCTRNDCARAGNASRASRTAGKPREINWWMNICDLRLHMPALAARQRARPWSSVQAPGGRVASATSPFS